MRFYTIPEALVFLAEEYGANRMPTSQETLRRAIRTGDLIVQEEGDPGRKGYTISEVDLRTYARNRLSRIEKRMIASGRKVGSIVGDASESLAQVRTSQEIKQFYEVYAQFLDGNLSEQAYFLELCKEKDKWETRLREKKEQMINLTSMMESLKNDIISCETNISDYQKGIDKIAF